MIVPVLCLALLGSTPQALIADGQKAVDALGTYSFRMIKRERVRDELHAPQEILATVREAPFAVRLEFVKGPARGRRVLYNSVIRAHQFRVREAGVFSVFGAIWIDVDTSLAKKHSKHTVLEAGLGNLMRRLEREQARAVLLGGFAVKKEGLNARGSSCEVWTSPNPGKGLDTASTRLCVDPKTALPSSIEAYDLKGTLLETYEFFDVKKVPVSEEFFVPGAGGV